MKLLFIVPHYYLYIDGVEYVVKSIVERLVKGGHEVDVLCGEFGINKPKEDHQQSFHCRVASQRM